MSIRFDAIVAADQKIEAPSLSYLLTIIHPIAIDIVMHEIALIKYYDIDPQKMGTISRRNNPEIEEVLVFPAMPNSLAIRTGMDYMPKADLPIILYEQSRQDDGFFETITIGG